MLRSATSTRAIERSRRVGVGETAAGIVLAITVFCMVLGSSSVTEAVGPGKKLRWVALVALVVIGLVLAARDLRRSALGRPLRKVLALGAWFAAVAIVSTAWSVDARLTFERAGSLALLFIAAGALALAAQASPVLPKRLLQGILAAAIAATAAGLVVLAFRHAAAVQPASDQSPARFRGLGQNPDTVSMLAGVAFPIAFWALLRAGGRAGRVAAAVSLALLVGAIAASGSRGGIVAALAGGCILSLIYPAPVRRRLSLALAVVVMMSAATAVTRIPKPLPSVAVAHPTKPGQLPLPGTNVGGPESQYTGRLADELYRFEPGHRSLLQSSGRLEAWRGAIGQADARPLLGYGFGTENKVFIDRFYNYQSEYAENSFVGLYLQLGAIGLLSLVALFVALCIGAARAIGAADVEAPGPVLVAVLATGIVLMVVQSYIYSVGNVVTVAFWVCGFAAAAAPVARERVRAGAADIAKGEAVAPA